MAWPLYVNAASTIHAIVVAMGLPHVVVQPLPVNRRIPLYVLVDDPPPVASQSPKLRYRRTPAMRFDDLYRSARSYWLTAPMSALRSAGARMWNGYARLWHAALSHARGLFCWEWPAT